MSVAFYESLRDTLPQETEIKDGFHYQSLVSLFRRHYQFDIYDPEVVKPYVFSVRDVVRGSKGQYKKKSITILKTDGTWGNVSILSCLKPPTQATLVRSAFRSEIHEQIQPLRDAIKPEEFICPLCGSMTEDFHIDHFPAPFKSIVEAFISERDISEASLNLKKDTETNYWILEDRTIGESWREYHKTNARLRAICKTCNLRRGTGEKSSRGKCLIVD